MLCAASVVYLVFGFGAGLRIRDLVHAAVALAAHLDLQALSRPGGEACAFAIVVADAWRNHGIGARLMRSLMQNARERGLLPGIPLDGLVLPLELPETVQKHEERGLHKLRTGMGVPS